ncbi:hypothetical protein [Nocardia yamanashiensis]|uniref:hypothetical protein n=1 Tax=Nocardia yamanashiensis TaxID=209247 RepID=UPI0012FE456C|nr:hypothetical protein [Nocardia yamanashiensis]
MTAYLERYVQEVRSEMGHLTDLGLRSGPRHLMEGDAVGAARLRDAVEHRVDGRSVVAADRNARADALTPRLSDGVYPIFPDRQKVADIVHSARSRTGNFGIGTGDRAEADAAGLAWAGADADWLPYNDTYRLVSSDKLRQYRPPQQKPAEEWKPTTSGDLIPVGRESNAHLAIEE